LFFAGGAGFLVLGSPFRRFAGSWFLVIGWGKEMPEICRFLGIVITMYFDDHNPPHIHVK